MWLGAQLQTRQAARLPVVPSQGPKAEAERPPGAHVHERQQQPRGLFLRQTWLRQTQMPLTRPRRRPRYRRSRWPGPLPLPVAGGQHGRWGYKQMQVQLLPHRQAMASCCRCPVHHRQPSPALLRLQLAAPPSASFSLHGAALPRACLPPPLQTTVCGRWCSWYRPALADPLLQRELRCWAQQQLGPAHRHSRRQMQHYQQELLQCPAGHSR